MSEERLWYPLDGTWHPSVATRLSALHVGVSVGKTSGIHGAREMLKALCSDDKVLYEADSYTEEEATRGGRALCARCRSKVRR